MLIAQLQNILKQRKLDLFDFKLEPRLQNHSFSDCLGNSKLKMQHFSHHSSAIVRLPSPTEQFDIHHPGVEMARSHIKQRHDSFVSALLLGGAYYHQHLRSAQYFPFPRRPLSAFPWLLHSSAIDVGFYSTAPPRTADLVSRYFLPPRFETRFGSSGFFFHSRAAPVKNQTFTILLGCKSELQETGGTCSFHAITPSESDKKNYLLLKLADRQVCSNI